MGLRLNRPLNIHMWNWQARKGHQHELTLSIPTHKSQYFWPFGVWIWEALQMMLSTTPIISEHWLCCWRISDSHPHFRGMKPFINSVRLFCSLFRAIFLPGILYFVCTVHHLVRRAKFYSKVPQLFQGCIQNNIFITQEWIRIDWASSFCFAHFWSCGTFTAGNVLLYWGTVFFRRFLQEVVHLTLRKRRKEGTENCRKS